MLRRVALFFLLLTMPGAALAQEAPIKALGRFDGWRENSLIGYGIVIGLAGTGDTRRSEVTRQALRNVLSRLGTSVSEDQINSRNAAVVIVTATLPPSQTRATGSTPSSPRSATRDRWPAAHC